jgi:hypothetical protein
MNKGTLKRLELLEAKRAKRKVQAKAALPAPLSCYLIACLGGHFDPGDSPAMNYARGLGLNKASDLAKLTPAEHHELHRKAWFKIFKRRGVNLDGLATPEEFDVVLMKLAKQLAKSGMPVPVASWLAVAA